MNSEIKVLLFVLENQFYGLPITDVKHVIRAVEITPLPKSPPIIKGIVNVAGNITPVIDIRLLMGLTARPLALDDYLIETVIFSQPTLLVVDDVHHLYECPSQEMVSAQKSYSDKTAHITGVFKKENDLIFVMDIEKLLTREDSLVLSQLAECGSKT